MRLVYGEVGAGGGLVFLNERLVDVCEQLARHVIGDIQDVVGFLGRGRAEPKRNSYGDGEIFGYGHCFPECGLATLSQSLLTGPDAR
jgi:hypothetical protein